MSLVSRSPSPAPPADAMDVDKYDEYVRRPEREVITVDTKINSSNKGFAMLAKLGWVEGQPLGLSGDGRIDPVPFTLKTDLTGLGKASQDVRMIESTVSQRRELDSERQTRESEEQRKAREESVAKRIAVQSEISSVLKAFYCELCDKQFKNVAQYDEHTNSYAHHHKARFRDMQAAQKASLGSQEEIDKRKEKERKREEKELRKIAKAAGIRMAKPAAPLVAAPSTGDPTSTGTRKTGWATVGSTEPGAAAPVASSSQAGWATAGHQHTAVAPSQPPSTAAPPPPPSSSHFGPAPAFTSGVWTSLDTGSTAPTPPTSSGPTVANVPTPTVAPPPAQVSNVRGGWAPAASAATAQSEFPATAAFQPPLAQPSQMTGVVPTQQVPRPPQPKPAVRQEAARSGWQQFKSGGNSGRRR